VILYVGLNNVFWLILNTNSRFWYGKFKMLLQNLDRK